MKIMIGKKVLDLNAGLGGRVYAFKEAGFEILAAIDNDIENCEIMKSWLPNTNIINANLLEVDPDTLPDADLIVAKYIQQSFSVSGKKGYNENTNITIYNIIEKKDPTFFLFEVPVSSLKTKRYNLEEYMQKFLMLGYDISYMVYDEMNFSGFPMVGKQGYIIGYKVLGNIKFKFPEPVYRRPIHEPSYENSEKVDQWYRKINFSTADWKRENWYLRNHGNVEKTSNIHMGYMRENYLVDSIGPRRFTHNEFAVFKGLYNCNYNRCNSKSRMYNKIAYASNVFVLKAIADRISDFIQSDDRKIVNEIKAEKLKIKAKRNTAKIIFPKYILKGITIKKLKGINNLSLEFDKNLIALMGVNGSGKSTILHALACTYSPYEKGENYRFSYFFTPNPDASWVNSNLTIVNRDFNEGKDHIKKYEKKGDRWARYSTRPVRDVFFMGISSCIPEIEIEKKSSFINYVSNSEKNKLSEKIIEDASYILNKNYEELMSHVAGRKKYIGVHTKEGIVYSALSMGAGEQRVIKILQTVYNAYQYSLILIDEIDLLLHADAFRKLIIRLFEIASDRNLQIIFTTHSMEMYNLKEYADIRYIEQQNNKMLVFDSIKPDLLYRLSGEMCREYSVYVEDKFAAAIVHKVAMELSMLRYINIITYGSIENAFTVAAGKVLGGEDISKILIVMDGDKLVTTEEKEKHLKAILSGTEEEHQGKINNALSMIMQFTLPPNTPPEKYVHSMLVTMNDKYECVMCAKNITSVKNSHDWIGKIETQMGIGEKIYSSIMSIVSEHEYWGNYVSEIRDWLIQKRKEVNLISINE
jgi:site-specific DNA-cytosine methylase/ABC-type lipoprotein export system ATPase subunit